MKAILIDAKNRMVREVEYSSLKEMQEFVGGLISMAWTSEDGDTLFVDDEGFLKASEGFFWFQPFSDQHGGERPLAGNGLLVGPEYYDHDGEYVSTGDPKLTVADVFTMIRFSDRAEIEAWGEANASLPSATMTFPDENGKPVTEVLGTWGDLIRDMPKPEKTDE